MRYRLKLVKQSQEEPASIMSKLRDIASSDITKRTLGMGLGGAVLGGGLLGGLNKTIKPGETEEERRKRIRNAVVIGALLGGTGGSAASLTGTMIPGSLPSDTIDSGSIDRHIKGPALGAGAGLGYAAYKGDVPTDANIRRYLQTDPVASAGGLIKDPVKGTWKATGSLGKDYMDISKTRNLMMRGLKRLGFSYKRLGGGPGYRMLAPVAIGAGVVAAINKLYDSGIIGTKDSVLQH